MKIPSVATAGDISRDPLNGVALNQIVSDKSIINTILANAFTSKKWSSAIKIGDLWLSIPSRIISVFDPNETNPEEYWKDPRDLPEGKINILKDLKITRSNPVSKDPLEKYIKFNIPSIENSVIPSESIGRLTNLVVQNNKPADKVFVLQFQCRDISIQNNIRPLMAQFLVSPFLPVHNAELNQIVNPPDENPELFIYSNKAFIDPNDGKFKWGSQSNLDISNIEGDLPQNVINYQKYINENISQVKNNTTIKQELLRLKAYWELPFYIQLIDFSISSIPDKRNSYTFNLVVRPVSLEPSFGGSPLYIKDNEGLKKQIRSNEVLLKNYKGDNKLVRNITRMFGMKVPDDDTGFKYNSERKNYNLFNNRFETKLREFQNPTNPLAHAVMLEGRTNESGINKFNYKAFVSSNTKEIENRYDSKFINNLSYDPNKNIIQNEINWPSSPKPDDPKIQGFINKFNAYPNNTSINTIQTIPFNNKNYFKFQLTPNVAFAGSNDQTEFKILQYNLKNFLKPEKDVGYTGLTEAGYQLRKALFAKLIAEQNADIICLQELGNTTYGIEELKQNIESLNGKKYNVIAHASNKTNLTSGNLTDTIGVGLLSTLPGFYTSIDLATYADRYNEKLENGAIKGAITLLSGNARPILKVTLERPEDNTSVIVFVCHFRSKIDTDNEYFRKFESYCLLNEILRLDDDQPFIVIGDFNYDLYSLDSIDLSSFNNNIIEYDELGTTFKHKFRTIGDKGEIDKSRSSFDEFIPIWDITLDNIIVENRETIEYFASRPIPENDFDIDLKVNTYYENFYNKKFHEFINKTIMFSTLKENYPAKTKNDILNYKLMGNPNVQNINPLDQSGTGTFFNVEKNREDSTEVTSMGFSIIDNIFYSKHFFKKGNIEYTNKNTKIINNYDDNNLYIPDLKNKDTNGNFIEVAIPDRSEKGTIVPAKSYFKRNVVPNKESLIDFKKKEQYSDHFPVISKFNWNLIPPSKLNNFIDPLEKEKQFFSNGQQFSNTISSNGTVESIKMEIFPFPLPDIPKVKEFSEVFNGTKESQDLLIYSFGGINNIKIILGIFYSTITNNYVYIYSHLNRNNNDFEPKSLEVFKTESDIIEKEITDLYSGKFSQLAIENLCIILEKELNEDDINIENLEIMTNLPKKDIREKIDKSMFYQYYNLIDNYEDISLNPGQVSSNISQCQPFRNYYLPLLEEFSDQIKIFDWKYNFEIDNFGSFIFNTYDVNKEDYKLYFSRKAPNRFGSTFIYSVTRAISILAKLNSDDPIDTQAKYLGEIANSVLYNSERIKLKANKISQIRGTTFEQSLNVLINNEEVNGIIPIGGPKFTGNIQTNGVVVRNVVAIEIIYYLAIQISIILILIDINFREEILENFTLELDPVLDIEGNVLTFSEFKDKMIKELKYKAYAFYQNQPVNYTKYVSLIERHLRLNNISGVDKVNNTGTSGITNKTYTNLKDIINDYNNDLNLMLSKMYNLYVYLEPIKIIEAV